jgi:hypothetical protein
VLPILNKGDIMAKKKLYAMFNRDKHGNIIGFCNDSFCMTYRYGCVHVWEYPPNHYFKPQFGDFIICLSKKNDEIEILLGKKNHTFKGNYLFKQKNKNGEWVNYEDKGSIAIGYKGKNKGKNKGKKDDK